MATALVPIIDPIERIERDILRASTMLSTAEARYLVDTYYQVQDFRIASAAQVRSLNYQGEPSAFVGWTQVTMEYIELQIKNALDVYTDQSITGQWLKSIVGIGPIIAAGLMAHIDITKAPTVGHIWRFAGLDPTMHWEKGEKRPWNADLKVICWKAGQSFMKVQSNPNDVYGKLYKQRKLWEIERNEAGELADQARQALETKRFKNPTVTRKAYEQGKLSDGHIDARARRWVVKLFLSHYHEVAYFVEYGELPPNPYVLEHVGGHVHRVEVPNSDLVPGLREARHTFGR